MQTISVPMTIPDKGPRIHSRKNDGDLSENLSSRSSLANVTLAGGIGGAVGDSAMYFLDTVKTRQQGAPNELKYRSSMTRALWTIVREEGVFRGLYSGYTPALLGSFPATMAFFGAYESSKRLLINKYHVPDTVSHLAAGFIGDFASSFIYVPSEVLKTRLQLQGRYNNPHFISGYNYKGMLHASRTIVKAEGYGALFYGYRATLIRDLPFSALQFAFYEKFRQTAQKLAGQGNDLSISMELGTGAAAGGLAGAMTTPLDVVKTRVQTQLNDPTEGSTSSGSKNVKLSASTWNGLKLIMRTEGVSGLFSGIGPRIVWTSVQSSIMLLVYQMALKMLQEGI